MITTQLECGFVKWCMNQMFSGPPRYDIRYTTDLQRIAMISINRATRHISVKAHEACNECSKSWSLWKLAGGSRGCEMSDSYTIMSQLNTSGRAVNKIQSPPTLAHMQRKYTDNWLIALYKGSTIQKTFPCKIMPIFVYLFWDPFIENITSYNILVFLIVSINFCGNSWLMHAVAMLVLLSLDFFSATTNSMFWNMASSVYSPADLCTNYSKITSSLCVHYARVCCFTIYFHYKMFFCSFMPFFCNVS